MDQMLYLPDDILVKVDRASMAVGLETRAPLLDYRLAEFMSTVPENLRYHNSIKKYLLKQAVRSKLPAEIIDRPKMGFAVPLKHWFHGQAADLVRDVLLSKSARERGIFRTAGTQAARRRAPSGPGPFFPALGCRLLRILVPEVARSFGDRNGRSFDDLRSRE